MSRTTVLVFSIWTFFSVLQFSPLCKAYHQVLTDFLSLLCCTGLTIKLLCDTYLLQPDNLTEFVILISLCYPVWHYVRVSRFFLFRREWRRWWLTYVRLDGVTISRHTRYWVIKLFGLFCLKVWLNSKKGLEDNRACTGQLNSFLYFYTKSS